MNNIVSIPNIAFKSALKNDIIGEILTTKIIDELNKIPNLLSYKMHNTITEIVCSLIENHDTATHKQDKKMDKKAIAMKILTLVFNLQPKEIDIIGHDIDYICSNNIVKKLKKTVVQKATSFFFAKKWLDILFFK